MYQLTASPDEIRIPAENKTITSGGRFWHEYQKWLAAGNKPDPEFNAAELKAKTAADKEAKSRADFAKRDFEEGWLASPEKAALK